MFCKENLEQFFDDHEDDFLRFERVQEKLSARPDLHAFLLLDKLVPGTGDMVSAAEHDEVWLDIDVDALCAVATEEQLVDLNRCGVRYDDDVDSLAMFV